MGYSPPTPKPAGMCQRQIQSPACKKLWIKLTIDKERPGIANNPAVEVETPTRSQHQEADEHDHGVLDEAPASADPVTNNADADLAGHDADDFEVGNSGNPVARAFLAARTPALRPGGSKQGREVADTEQDIAFETQSGAGQDCVAKVVREGAERVVLEHLPRRLGLLLVLGSLDATNELYALQQGQVGPVDTLGREAVFWMGHVAENAAFLLRGACAVLQNRVFFIFLACFGTVWHGDHARRRVVMYAVTVGVKGRHLDSYEKFWTPDECRGLVLITP